MTTKYAAGFFAGGVLVQLLASSLLGEPRLAHARGETEGAKTVVVPCDRRMPRTLLGGASGDDATFAVREFPGKSAADLARVRVLAKLRDVQSGHATYTENAPVLLRDGSVIVACDAQSGAGSPAIESALLVFPE